MNSPRYQTLARTKPVYLLALSLLATVLFFSNTWATQTTAQYNTDVELLMIDSEDCPYCRKFDREIASIYPKTDEGRRAPLSRHHLGDEIPIKYAGIDINKETMTPTFILIKDNQEVDRLVGYNGDEFFWFLLNELLDKLHTE